MGRVLPILFNGDMVRAILDGRKTVTRRAVKYKYSNTEMKMRTDKYGTNLIEIQKDVEGGTHGKNPDGSTWHRLLPYIEKNPPYKKGDILYVRETWAEWTDGYIYKTWVSPFPQPGCYPTTTWHPSIHMPKQAARIWLRVTDVKVERLQKISEVQAAAEGAIKCYEVVRPDEAEPIIYQAEDGGGYFVLGFKAIWNSAIKKPDIDRYGWAANPWVWVIEFERCGKPESEG